MLHSGDPFARSLGKIAEGMICFICLGILDVQLGQLDDAVTQVASAAVS